MPSATTTASEIASEMARQTEVIILDQLNELVSRGLIVVERTEPILVQEYNPTHVQPYQLKMQMKVRLKLKDQEYIESLEKKLAAINAHMQAPVKDLNWLSYLHDLLQEKPNAKY